MSLSVALFISLPVVAAVVATAFISRYAPMEESPSDKKRSPKRQAQSATVDESLAVSRAMERRQELGAPVAAGLGAAPVVAGAVVPASGMTAPAQRRAAETEDPEERFAHLVPPEFREDFSHQLADGPALD